MITRKILCIGALLCLGLGNTAQALELGFGPRVGLSRSPNGIEVGGQLILTDWGIDLIAPLRLETSVDWGFGKTDIEGEEGVKFTAIHANANLQYVILRPTKILQFYPMVGFGWYRQKIREVTTDVSGLNLGGGLLYRGLGAQLSFGLRDLPNLTLTASYTFRF